MKAAFVVTILLLACARPDPELSVAADMLDGQIQSAELCASCHPRQYDEWRQSMHAYAALSPVFDAMTAKAYRDSTGDVGTFCTGCHTPQGALAGEPGSSTAATRSELSREGINCDGCHTAIGHGEQVGNALIERDLSSVRRGPYEGGDYGIHQGEYSDFVTSPELCGSCHDVFTFPGVRIEEAFTEYSASPAAEEGVRCQDCHMGPVPGQVSERPWGPSAIVNGVPMGDREQASHRFIGVDYSLLDSFPYPDDPEAGGAARAEYLEQVQSLVGSALEIAQVSGEVEESSLLVDVVVQSRVAGHGIPTGFTSERQVWVDITVTDADGQVILRSGDLDDYGDLRDAHSWEVQAGSVEEDDQLVNYQSTNLAIARAFSEDGTFAAEDLGYEAGQDQIFPFDANTVIKNNLGPLEQRTHSYTMARTRGPYQVEVTMYYRNLAPYLLRALQLDDLLNRLNTFEMASASATLDLDAEGGVDSAE